MPTDLQDAETGGIDLHFADDLEGTTFVLREEAVYEAEEVRSEIGGDVPKFGSWLPVTEVHENGDEIADGWAVAIGELVEELQDATVDVTTIPFTITRVSKAGNGQTDPYEVNTEPVEQPDDDQTSL